MGPQKTTVSFNFGQGLELKADPKQIPTGKFLSLQNTQRNKGGLLQKRNGFGQLTTVPTSGVLTHLTTFNNNLTAISNTISAFDPANNVWINKGNINPISLNTLPLIRSNTNQSQADIAISSNGLLCTAFTDQDPSNLSNPVYKYAVANSITGQNIIAPTEIPANGGGTLVGAPRVFNFGSYFIVLFTNHISSQYHLQFIAISTSMIGNVSAPQEITSYVPSAHLSYDAVVCGNRLFIVYNNTSGGQSVNALYIDNSLNISSILRFTGNIATVMGVTTDNTNIAAAFYDSGSSTGYSLVFNQALQVVRAPVQIISSGTILNIAPALQTDVVTTYFEVQNAYSYDSSIPTHYIRSISVPNSTGIATSPFTVVRSVGLASKAFIVNNTQYFLSAYQSSLQPTYFMINGSVSTQLSPVIPAKLAYSNGGGYLPTGLPNAIVDGNNVSIPYLFKDLITSVSKATNPPTGTQIDGIYSQTGINYATFTLNSSLFDSVEIGSSLQLSGGYLGMYDGYLPVENNFFVWPDDIEVTWSDTGGTMVANPPGWVSGQPSYAYQVIYEWTDNQGNAHRSAPSVPVYITLSSDVSTMGSVTIDIPTLRLTYKTANPVKISIFRWSIAQQEFFQITSITTPLLNDLSVDSMAYLDTLSDSAILGNALIYTTGGVVEDVSAPSTSIMTLWQSRLFQVNAEDQNSIWFSKVIIENTPVEMSDLFTIFVAPTLGASGSTGPITALGAMDDKLIVFKRDAIYYITGTGPDNTGANNLFSDPIYITSTVGCTNQQSLVLTPQGLMFQSDKGIWLLDRSLQTSYIGAPVDSLALSANVLSSVLIPGTNQIRFVLDSNIILMFDYYYNEWQTFNNNFAISSCIQNSLHTFLDSYGRVFQETPGQYLDGSEPVLISLKTGWLNLAGIQSYQRIYELALVGDYLSPHKLEVQLAYDFGNPIQQSTINPTNFTGVYGSDSLYGQTTPFGGPGSLEQWRIHAQKQKCQVFQISVNEVYDPSFGVVAGAGFNLSAITCVVGVKGQYRPYKAAQSVG